MHKITLVNKRQNLVVSEKKTYLMSDVGCKAFEK